MVVRVFDLSMFVDGRTPVYPGDPKQELRQLATIEKNGWNEKRMTFNSHFSTHIDAPFHMLPGGKKLDDFPLESFIGEGIVLDARGQREIDVPLDGVRTRNFVFFCTGHTDKAYTPDFFKNDPVLSITLAKKLVRKKVSIAGLDSFTPDHDPFPVHKLLFKHNIRIVENLVNLKPLTGKRFECIILPLKIAQADGAPCRVIARNPRPAARR